MGASGICRGLCARACATVFQSEGVDLPTFSAAVNRTTDSTAALSRPYSRCELVELTLCAAAAGTEDEGQRL